MAIDPATGLERPGGNKWLPVIVAALAGGIVAACAVALLFTLFGAFSDPEDPGSSSGSALSADWARTAAEKVIDTELLHLFQAGVIHVAAETNLRGVRAFDERPLASWRRTGQGGERGGECRRARGLHHSSSRPIEFHERVISFRLICGSSLSI